MCLTPVGLTWAGLCSPKMATIRASGAVTPLPGDTGLRGLMGDGTVSGETSRSFFATEQGERLCAWQSLERGPRLRPCNEGRGLEERAETAGLRLRRWRWWYFPVLGLGLREFGASRTRVLSSSELISELSVRHTVGLWAGNLICWRIEVKITAESFNTTSQKMLQYNKNMSSKKFFSWHWYGMTTTFPKDVEHCVDCK